jgi:aspartate/methionine/tyrosine aminotransferase
MALKVAARGKVPPFIVMDVMRAANEKVAAGEAVLHLEVGQPGTSAPKAVLEAAHRALDKSLLGYTDAFGIPALRRRLAAYYGETYNVDLDPARVAVTVGSSGGFLLAFLAAFAPGDRVALAAPGYPAYRNILQALGVEAVLLETDLAHRYQPTPELLAAAGPLDGLIVASPSNPTGTMLGRGELQALVDYCAAEEIRLVSDEIYHGITFGAPAVSALELSDSAIVINSFSKYFSMTGWRLGYSYWPAALIEGAKRLAVNCHSCVNAAAQWAGLAALQGPQDAVDDMIAAFDTRRRVVVEGLNALPGVSCVEPGGAFYAFPNITGTGMSAKELEVALLEEAGVATLAGTSFGEYGEGYLRISYANSLDNIQEALSRIAKLLDAKKAANG